ncbi:40S ribosomal protein S27-like [Collichthys lucidus]|uniref:40S ribosomal protein S27-like n=1 Tax=Collichthys lucidus TaxID=240159 RepID=A0A4U5VJL6_COLLU|nr:40S ribosomal protein S27-like [Collichthys lucidus]
MADKSCNRVIFVTSGPCSRGTTDMNPSLPVMPPFRQRLFPRQHARCYKITTVFSHAQTVVLCVGCSTVLCQPTGGKARLTEGQY